PLLAPATTCTFTPPLPVALPIFDARTGRIARDNGAVLYVDPSARQITHSGTTNVEHGDHFGGHVECLPCGAVPPPHLHQVTGCVDRKSTRLNSSHVSTSYAVFCL